MSGMDSNHNHSKSPTDGDELVNVTLTSLFNITTVSPTVNRGSVAAVVTWWNILLSVLQWAIFVIGTLGNLLVLFVLFWNRSRKQLVTQLFVGSLSLAGLVMMLTQAWEQAIGFVESDWKYGPEYCRIVFYLQPVTTYILIWTMTLLAGDR